MIEINKYNEKLQWSPIVRNIVACLLKGTFTGLRTQNKEKQYDHEWIKG